MHFINSRDFRIPPGDSIAGSPQAFLGEYQQAPGIFGDFLVVLSTNLREHLKVALKVMELSCHAPLQRPGF